jgi:hypothetical protein
VKTLAVIVTILASLASCVGKTPPVSSEHAVLIAVFEASKREPVLPEAYETVVEGNKGEWIVKFKPKPQGRRNGIWVYVDQQTGAVKKTQFWQ